jgi:hypothetical protein
MLKSIDFGQLMRAAEGLTQWRVLGLSFLTWLAGGLVMVGGQMLATRAGSMLLALLFLVIASVVFSAGMSAVGILLQDKAKDVEQRSVAAACCVSRASSCLACWCWPWCWACAWWRPLSISSARFRSSARSCCSLPIR